MNSLLICLNAIVPLFLMIAAGYLAKRVGIIREEQIPGMNAVAFKVFMPLMCFYNVYSSDLSSVIRPGLMLFVALGILAEFALSWIAGTRITADKPRRGVVIQGLYRSNYLILGMPFAAGLVGEGSLGTAAMVGAVAVPLFNVLAVVALEIHSGGKPALGTVLRSIVKNPLILGTAAGLAALLIKLRLPGAIESAVRDMSRVTTPLMLFLLGAFFRFDGSKSHRRELITVCAGRLIVIPAVMLTIAALLGFRGIEFVTLIAVFASSTAVASFTMAQQMGGDAALAGDIVVMTSALCSFTLFAWSLLFKSLGLF